MSHVDEGALHAYLDGALDEFPAAEAERIRLHLETCPHCVEELDVARRLRSEAATILGLAAPDLTLPTLEELRAVEKRRRPAPPVASAGLRRLGWAASIALAIGAGWLLREGQLRQVGQAGVAPGVAVETEATGADSDATLLAEGVGPGATADDDPAEAAGNPVSPEGEADGGRRMPSTDQATPRVALASSTVGVADGFGPDDAGDGRGTVLLEELDAPAALTAATDAARPLAAGPVERLSVVSVPSASETLRSGEPSASSRDRSGPLVPVASASAVDRGGMARRRELSDDDLPRDKAVALAVPGYDVRSIVNLGGGTTSLGVHVQQSLDHSVTFDVYHLEAGVAPEVLEPAPAGVAEVRVESEEGWVVIRGELDDATLSELLARLFSE